MRVEDVANITANSGLMVLLASSSPSSVIEATAKLVVAVALLVSAYASLRKASKGTTKNEDK